MDPSSSEPVTLWLDQLKAGDREAARKLFDLYFERLVKLARAKLGPASRRVADEEDVAASAFESFCRVVKEHKYSQLEHRDDLWKLLYRITERKALDQIQSQARQKRGGGTVRGDSVFFAPGKEDDTAGGFSTVPSDEPTPAAVIEMADEIRRLFEALGDAELRQIAQLKLDGHTNEEIRLALKCSLATVERRLAVIRAVWERFLKDSLP